MRDELLGQARSLCPAGSGGIRILEIEAAQKGDEIQTQPMILDESRRMGDEMVDQNHSRPVVIIPMSARLVAEHVLQLSGFREDVAAMNAIDEDRLIYQDTAA